MSVRIATFNVENLMQRFDFSGWRKEMAREHPKAGPGLRAQSHAQKLEQARLVAHADDARQMTALAIADTHADIVCLQEVENLQALEEFERDYVSGMTGLSYPEQVLIEGNDTRGIDVALMARRSTSTGESIEIGQVISHGMKSFERLGVYNTRLAKMGIEAKDRVFRRDCLEVNLRIGGKPVTLFVCHFKSMGPFRNGMTGREYTMPVRQAEAQSVRNIIEDKFGGARAARMRWLICGDLNDYTERQVISGNRQQGYRFAMKKEDHSGIDPLLADDFAISLMQRRARDDRWTLYYASGAIEEPADPKNPATHHLVQLDYLLASPAIAKANAKALPHVVRSGQPHRTVFPEDQDVERYPRTGWDRPKASDHCPVAVTLKIV